MDRQVRVYRALLRLLPPGYRRQHGAALERLFRDTLTEWRRERGAPGAGFWLSVIGDASRAAAAEWLRALGDAVRPDPARGVGEHMSTLMGDVRFALRQVARQPAHGLMVVLLMTLGVGGNAAVFRIFDGLFLKPLPFEEAERLLDLDETAPRWDLEFVGMAYPDFVAWRRDNRSFEGMAVFTGSGANLSDGVSAERVSLVQASHDLDDVLRIEPEIGRFFTEEEDVPGPPRVALLTHGFWESRFAADPSVVGRTISLSGIEVEIIGVLSRTADFVADAEIWIPLGEDVDSDSGWYLSGVGRLLPGVSLEQAREDLLAIHKGMIADRDVNDITSPVLHTLRERYLGDYEASSGFLLGAVGIVLLIACANIAGLMFARSLARGPEIAVRLAMGAPRGRIVRQLLTESAILAVLGAAAGAALGAWSSGLLVERLRRQFPSWVTFDLDGTFVAFTVLVTAGAALLFGLAPALHAAGQPAASLGGSSRSTASRRRRRALSTLVAAEVALAVGLLVVGGLSVLDAHRVGRIDPGFAIEGVTTWRVELPAVRYENSEARLAFVDRYLERLQAIPGVLGATAASSLPLSGHWGWFYSVEGAPPRDEGESNPVVLTRAVTPGYFDAMDVRIVQGRALDDFDGREDGARAVVVNETFVRTHMADGRDPVGRRIHTGQSPPADDAGWITVVGVARDVKHYGLDEPVRPGVYQPMRQIPRAGFMVAVRSAPGAASPLPTVRAITAEMDAELPLYQERTMKTILDDSLWTRRATSWVIGAFSTVALLLAVAGLYGVISYSVGQRAREISIRMAMGARAQQVRGQVVRQGMVVVAAGVAVGLGVVLALGGVVSRILSQVGPTEPIVYVGVCALLVVVAGLASWLPARRAAALDPMAVLRSE